jgi:hypothetical protein
LYQDEGEHHLSRRSSYSPTRLVSTAHMLRSCARSWRPPPWSLSCVPSTSTSHPASSSTRQLSTSMPPLAKTRYRFKRSGYSASPFRRAAAKELQSELSLGSSSRAKHEKRKFGPRMNPGPAGDLQFPKQDTDETSGTNYKVGTGRQRQGRRCEARRCGSCSREARQAMPSRWRCQYRPRPRPRPRHHRPRDSFRRESQSPPWDLPRFTHSVSPPGPEQTRSLYHNRWRHQGRRAPVRHPAQSPAYPCSPSGRQAVWISASRVATDPRTRVILLKVAPDQVVQEQATSALRDRFGLPAG